MKLVYQCMHCKINIFDANQDVCRDTPIRKHSWRIIEQEQKDKIPTKYKKEIIYG